MLLMIPLFFLGAAGASFANCLASRMLIGQSLCYPKRSYCPNCQHPLSWWQLIPVFGWVRQKGRCYFCNAIISPWSTFCELICGLSFVILWNSTLLTWVASLVVFSTLSFLATTDYQQMVIFPLAIVGLLPLVQLFPWCFPHSALSIGLCTFYSIFLLTLSKCHHSLGIGDCEIFTLIFWLTGPVIGIAVVLLSCLLIVPIVICHRKQQPFVPAIAISLIFLSDLIAIYPSLLAAVWSSILAN